MNIKRIEKDYREILKCPLIDASAEPTENDLTLWHCSLLIYFTINKNVVKAPLHFLIDLSKDYPKNPPDVGFLSSFPYNQGANGAATDGRLKSLF